MAASQVTGGISTVPFLVGGAAGSVGARCSAVRGTVCRSGRSTVSSPAGGRGPRGNGKREAESSRWRRRKRAKAASTVSAQPAMWPRPTVRWPCPAGGARRTDGRGARAGAAAGQTGARQARARASARPTGGVRAATARWRCPATRARGDEQYQPVVPAQGKLQNDKQSFHLTMPTCSDEAILVGAKTFRKKTRQWPVDSL